MKNWIYVNNRNDHKIIELRRYDCGHYVWKQSIRANGITNYNGCSLRRAGSGVWRRVSRSWFTQVLSDYTEV